MHYIIMHYNDLLTNTAVYARVYVSVCVYARSRNADVTWRYLMSAIVLHSSSFDTGNKLIRILRDTRARKQD